MPSMETVSTHHGRRRTDRVGAALWTGPLVVLETVTMGSQAPAPDTGERRRATDNAAVESTSRTKVGGNSTADTAAAEFLRDGLHAPGVRGEKVLALRAAIANGTYRIPAEVVVERMLERGCKGPERLVRDWATARRPASCDDEPERG